MQKTYLNKLELTIYSEKLPNGLEVFVIPKDNCRSAYATFTTRYGSTESEFVPLGKTEYIKVPDGVAHFLEHKMFEQEDGIDPFTAFIKNGSDSNAFTNFHQTTYLFSGPKNVLENLNFLIDFVQSPYFTDENVEKEKGIIIEEIRMYKDNPYRSGYQKVLENAFINDPVRIAVAGSEESVKKITKEDLYTCYNTFYHPSNMFVVVTGNIDPALVIETVRENQSKKDFMPKEDILVKTIDEPDNVLVKREEVNMNIVVPKLFLGYKLNVKGITDIPLQQIIIYINIIMDLKFGGISLFLEQLKKDNIVNYDVGISITRTSNHLFLLFDADSSKPDELLSKIEEEIGILNFSLEEFESKKKAFLSSCIYMSDNIYSMNKRIMNDLISTGTIVEDIYGQYKSLNYTDLLKVFNNISFNNNATLIIKPKKDI